MARGTAGMKADPSCSLHAIAPVLYTARFAARPMHIPSAVYICQLITSAPRILAGALSAAKTGTVEAFSPMPSPMRMRVTSSCTQFCERAEPMTGKRQSMAEAKIVMRRPSHALRGSQNQTPIMEAER